MADVTGELNNPLLLKDPCEAKTIEEHLIAMGRHAGALLTAGYNRRILMIALTKALENHKVIETIEAARDKHS
jgi:hypothetical protein